MATIGLSGGDKLEAKLAEIARKMGKGGTLRVGFLEGATYPDGTSVPYVAAIQEFGAPSRGIPPRPYFRPMIAEKSGAWGKSIGDLAVQHDYDADTVLERMGVGISDQLRNSIMRVTGPALSPVTLLLRELFGNHPEEITFADVMDARRQIAAGRTPKVSGTGAKPLQWTGHMLNSVNFEVQE